VGQDDLLNVEGVRLKTSFNPTITNKDPVVGRQYIPKEYQQFVQDHEATFIKLMLEQMEKTVPSDEEDGEERADASAKDYYKDMMLTQRAEMMAKKDGGLGLQKVFLDQIYPEGIRNKFQYEAYQRMHESPMRSTQPTIGRAESTKVHEESAK